MFHTPLNEREKVAAQRYSASGYPCLYLGINVYSCWAELQPVAFNDLMFSGFKVERGFKLFDLRFPTRNDYVYDKLSDLLLRLPLIIACFFVVRKPNESFKPEYIIPQLLTEIVISKNCKSMEKDGRAISELIWGIIYTSTHCSEMFGFDRHIQQNIALPVIEAVKEKDCMEQYCNVLASLFSISQPTCLEYEELKGSETFLRNRAPTESDEVKRYNYDHSKFMFLEGRIRRATPVKLPHHYVDRTTILLDQEGTPAKNEVISTENWLYRNPIGVL